MCGDEDEGLAGEKGVKIVGIIQMAPERTGVQKWGQRRGDKKATSKRPGRLGVGDEPAARARYTGFVTTVDRGIIHAEALHGINGFRIMD